MNYRLSTALVAAALLLTGCAGQGIQAPVEDRTQRGSASPSVSDSVAPATGVVVRPVEPVPLQGRPLSSEPVQQQEQYTPEPVYVPPPVTPSAQPPRNAAVVALLNTATSQKRAGSLGAAQASLERAQRIAPRDPEVYYQLADLHRRKSDFRQAEQMALRGLEVAHGQPTMQRALWLMVSKVRQAAGDPRGAQEARDRANRY